jgi:hypothetical protein
LCFMLLDIVITALFIRNVIKNNRIEQDKKALSIFILLFLWFLAIPIYWYLYIWRGSDNSRDLHNRQNNPSNVVNPRNERQSAQTKNILLGGLTILPWILLGIGSFFESSIIKEPYSIFILIMPVNLCVICLIGFYISHISKNKNLFREQKNFWMVVVVFGHLVSMPIYWYFQVWRKTQDQEE